MKFFPFKGSRVNNNIKSQNFVNQQLKDFFFSDWVFLNIKQGPTRVYKCEESITYDDVLILLPSRPIWSQERGGDHYHHMS